MKNSKAVMSRAILSVLLAGFFAMPAHAGFDWNPPPAAPAISTIPGDAGPAVPAAPATDVDVMELTPIPGSPSAQIDPVDSLPPPASYQPSRPFIERENTALPSPTVPEMLDAPSPSGPYANAVGFGTDIPLALALTQIVPSEFAYSFGPQVNPGLKISWNGGKPWNEVLNEALQPHDLRADLAGAAVVVRKGAGVPRTSASRETSYGYSTVPKPPADMPAVMGAPHSSAAPAVKGEGSANYPRRSPQNKSFFGSIFSSEDKNETWAPRPAADNNSAIIKNEIPVMETSAAEPVAREAAAFEPSAPAMTARMAPRGPVPVQSQKISYAEETLRSNSPILSERIPSDGSAMDSQAIVLDPFQVGFWQGDSTQSLREVLQTWSDKAGVEVIWDSGYEYKLPTSISMHGTFPEAVSRVFSLYGVTEPRPQGKLHPNLPKGPSVLLVENYP